MKSEFFSGGSPQQHLQIEDGTYLLNRKLEAHDAENDIARDRTAKDG